MSLVTMDIPHSVANVEEWRPIPGYEQTIQVSNMGRVKSFHKYKGWLDPVSPNADMRGYCHIRPRLPDNKRACIRVHHAVYTAFVGPIQSGCTIDHIDRNRSNNVVGNLRAALPSEQRANTKKHALRRDARSICVWRLSDPKDVMTFNHSRQAEAKLGANQRALRAVANGKARRTGEFGARWASDMVFLPGEKFRTIALRIGKIRVSNRGRYLDGKSRAFAVIPKVTPGNDYAKVGSCNVSMHRVVAAAWPELIGGTYGPGKTIDHIDRDVNNNDPSNLRWATAVQQAANRRSSRDFIHTSTVDEELDN